MVSSRGTRTIRSGRRSSRQRPCRRVRTVAEALPVRHARSKLANYSTIEASLFCNIDDRPRVGYRFGTGASRCGAMHRNPPLKHIAALVLFFVLVAAEAMTI